MLQRLHSEGFSLKAVIDMIPSIEYKAYIDQSLYEQEVLKLYESIAPPLSSYTMTSKDLEGDSKAGRSKNEDPDSPDTIASQDLDKNDM